MATQPTTGVVLSLSASEPATFDQAGFEALTFTEMFETLTVPAFGAETQVITFEPLKDGITKKEKGFVNYGSLAVVAVLDADDAGQNLAESAADGANKLLEHSFKIEYPKGEVRYFTGKVFSYQEDPGSSNEMINVNINIEINSEVLKIAAP